MRTIYSSENKLISWVETRFESYSGWAFSGLLTDGDGEGGKKAPLSKICHTYPTTMKLDTLISYLKKIQKLYESRDTSPEFC